MAQYYKFAFTAILDKLTLRLKIPCQIEVFWKRGQKVAQSGKSKLQNNIALFQKSITIHCNMKIDPETKNFQSKITKFSILLYSQRGTKQAGEIEFDVATYLNQKRNKPKQYEINLKKCPDEKSKLVFTLKAALIQQVSQDNISHGSAVSYSIEQILAQKEDNKQSKTESSIKTQAKLPPKAVSQKHIPQNDMYHSTIAEPSNDTPWQAKMKILQESNRKIAKQLRDKQRIAKENQQLKRKLKNEQFQSVKDLKVKIENCKKQIETIKNKINSQKHIEKEIRQMEEEIFKCKIRIMNSFNAAMEIGGDKLMNKLQEICGVQED